MPLTASEGGEWRPGETHKIFIYPRIEETNAIEVLRLAFTKDVDECDRTFDMVSPALGVQKFLWHLGWSSHFPSMTIVETQILDEIAHLISWPYYVPCLEISKSEEDVGDDLSCLRLTSVCAGIFDDLLIFRIEFCADDTPKIGPNLSPTYFQGGNIRVSGLDRGLGRFFGGGGGSFGGSDGSLHIARLYSGSPHQAFRGSKKCVRESSNKDCGNGGNRVPIFVNQVAGTLDTNSGPISKREKEFWRVFFCLLGIGVILTCYAILK